MRLALVIVGLAACGGQQSSTTAQISGDTCAVHIDQTSCVAQSGCQWFGLGRPCPADGSYCQSGVCQGPSSSGSGTGSGSASGGAACACPDGGVCFEQIGGPAQQTGGGGDQIMCAVPAAGSGDACARIEGEGTCRDSETVSGLCICDNGIR
jgi:hypothetical protein